MFLLFGARHYVGAVLRRVLACLLRHGTILFRFFLHGILLSLCDTMQAPLCVTIFWAWHHVTAAIRRIDIRIGRVRLYGRGHGIGLAAAAFFRFLRTCFWCAARHYDGAVLRCFLSANTWFYELLWHFPKNLFLLIRYILQKKKTDWCIFRFTKRKNFDQKTCVCLKNHFYSHPFSE